MQVKKLQTLNLILTGKLCTDESQQSSGHASKLQNYNVLLLLFVVQFSHASISWSFTVTLQSGIFLFGERGKEKKERQIIGYFTVVCTPINYLQNLCIDVCIVSVSVVVILIS